MRSDCRIVAFVINKTLPESIAKFAEESGAIIIEGGDIDKLIETVSFDTAIVLLPHVLHKAVTEKLQTAGKYIIKEKPLALSREQASTYSPLFTTTQRTTAFTFLSAKADLKDLGTLKSFRYTYTFNLDKPTSGWRADPIQSGGGVVIDMGYHVLDVVFDFFGMPLEVKSICEFKYPETKAACLEDSCYIEMDYPDGLSGVVILDRHAKTKCEAFEIYGTEGYIKITPHVYELRVGDYIKRIIEQTKPQMIQDIFDVCLTPGQHVVNKQFERNLQVMTIIDKIYEAKK